MNLIRKITAITIGVFLMNITGCGRLPDEDVNLDNTNLPEQPPIESSGDATPVDEARIPDGTSSPEQPQMENPAPPASVPHPSRTPDLPR